MDYYAARINFKTKHLDRNSSEMSKVKTILREAFKEERARNILPTDPQN